MIITFSGTGNSFYVSDILSAFFGGEEVVRLQYERLLDDNPVIDFNNDNKPVIWVFPVYSWGIPPVVLKFIKKCRTQGDEKSVHHLILTCGDDVGDAAKKWIDLIEKKKWKRGGIWSVQMPNTYTLMKGFDVDPIELAKNKLSTCRHRIEEIAEKVKKGSDEIDVVKGAFPLIKSYVINPWFVRYAMSSKPFHALENCISCGLCEQDCPTDNIRMLPEHDLSARPAWGMNCALCLRCYHHCPVNAIQYGKHTKNKGQYRIQSIIKDI